MERQRVGDTVTTAHSVVPRGHRTRASGGWGLTQAGDGPDRNGAETSQAATWQRARRDPEGKSWPAGEGTPV